MLNPSKENDYLKCVYRNEKEFFCPDAAEFIAFKKHIKTKDYDLIALSFGQLGSGTRWHDWKLIIDDGKKAVAKTLADGCIECDIAIELLKFRSNEVTFTYRQEQHRIVATFRAGDFSIRKSKLNPREPLPESVCNRLYGQFEACSHTERNSPNCYIGGGKSGHFFVMETEDKYAGISYSDLDGQCKKACSTGKAMDRSTFFKEACRRRTPS